MASRIARRVGWLSIITNAIHVKAINAHRAEIALPFGERWNRAYNAVAFAVAEAFVESEEESLPSTQRTADASAKLVLLQGFNLRVRKAGCIKGIITQELPKRAVQRIRSGTRDDVGGRAQIMSEFGVGNMGQDSELFDRINRRLQDKSAVHAIEVVRAIYQEIIRLGSLAINCVPLLFAK